MERFYNKPSMEFFKFEIEDIITGSTPAYPGQGGAGAATGGDVGDQWDDL